MLQHYLEDLGVDGKIMLNRSSVIRLGGGRDRLRRVKGSFNIVMKFRAVQFYELLGIS